MNNRVSCIVLEVRLCRKVVLLPGVFSGSMGKLCRAVRVMWVCGRAM